VTAGTHETCAVRADKELQCWMRLPDGVHPAARP